MTELAFSPEQLEEKYRAERDKRLALRPEGNAQYVEATGVFADFQRDPYVEPGFSREAIVDEVDVVIVGAGLGALMAAARLTQQGIRNFRIVDKAGDFGGTWYWNRYPGAACDVESYIYMPFLEETGYIPTEKYARAPEIFEHCQRIARHFDLYPLALFQTEMDALRWDDARARWTAATSRGDRLTARFALIAGGVLHKPKLPGIPGLGDFAGQSFHTTRWNYAVTGGSPTEAMDKLADKRVGIIGTGATAVQAVPRLAEAAKHLYVFQRTPSAVGVRGNGPTDAEWAKSLQPGWQQSRMDSFTAIMAGEPWDEDPIQDGWTEMYRNHRGAVPTPEQKKLDDYAMMENIRARIDAIVPDKATAAALKPWYSRMCKRPCFHDEYLHAFARPNVTLVDTAGRGIERLTADALVVDGVAYPVDVLIYASGFEMGTSYKSRLGFEIYGRDNVALTDAWAPEGAATLHGIFTRGFPNLLMFSTTQGGFAINFAHILNELAVHAAHVIRRCLDGHVRTVEPTDAAQAAWWMEIMRHLPAAMALIECTPSYMNAEGARSIDPKLIKAMPFFGPSHDYIGILREWRRRGAMDGLEITTEPAAA